jgi:hypothetical protein
MKSHLGEILSAALGVAVICTPAHAKVPPGRYVIGDDSAGFGTPAFPVVFDTKTKLTWQQGFKGPFTADDLSMQADICLQLDQAIKTTGWRLPTTKELLTLIDFNVPYTAPVTVDPTAFPNNPLIGGFWSSTTSPSQPLQCVQGGTLGCGANIYIRCVR